MSVSYHLTIHVFLVFYLISSSSRTLDCKVPNLSMVSFNLSARFKRDLTKPASLCCSTCSCLYKESLNRMYVIDLERYAVDCRAKLQNMLPFNVLLRRVQIVEIVLIRMRLGMLHLYLQLCTLVIGDGETFLLLLHYSQILSAFICLAPQKLELLSYFRDRIAHHYIESVVGYIH